MSADNEGLRQELTLAQAEALRVGDSPVRADRLADQVETLRAGLATAGLTEEQTNRIAAHLDDALRVLRRDDDGREAAKHLQAASRWLEPRSRAPSPFLDD